MRNTQAGPQVENNTSLTYLERCGLRPVYKHLRLKYQRYRQDVRDILTETAQN